MPYRYAVLLLLTTLTLPAQAQWTRIDTNGLPRNGILAVSSVAASEQAVLATANNGLYRSTNDGTTWTQVTGVPAASVVSMSGASGLVQNGSASVFVSLDHGGTWAARPSLPSLANAVNAFVRVQTGAGRSHLYISSTQEQPNKLWVTHDDFATVQAALPGETIEQVTTNGSVLLATSGFSPSARYFRSTDGGRTWAQTASPGVGAVSIYGSRDSLFVAGLAPTSMRLFGSKDGVAWTDLGPGGIPMPAEADPSHSAAFGYTGSGFNLSVRSGRGVVSITSNFPAQTFGTFRMICHQTGAGGNRAITSRFAYAMATCDDAGQTIASALYRHPISGAVRTAAEIGTAAPGLTLDAPAPHPARGRTSVSFTLTAPGAVQFVVLDLLGRTVATLVDGPRAAGAATVDVTTEALPAGVYLLRLTTAGGAVSRPLVVAR